MDWKREEEDKDREGESKHVEAKAEAKEIDKDREGLEWWTEVTEAKMTWIHGTSIDCLRMKSQRQSSAYKLDK